MINAIAPEEGNVSFIFSGQGAAMGQHEKISGRCSFSHQKQEYVIAW